jgi:hypothetical protein
MQRHSVFQVVPLTAAMIALLGVCAGCEKKKEGDDKGVVATLKAKANNLDFVECSSKNGGGKNVTIQVTPSPQVLGYADRIIFVCAGELVSWHTSSPNTTIEIHFKDKGKSAKLFKTHEVDLDSVPGSADAATPPKEVGDTGSSDLAHAYTIIVKQGSDVFKVDPHIIPVGN